MSRPKKNRLIKNLPSFKSFIPERDFPCAKEAPPVILTLDELEAIRLADMEGLYQQHGAEHMGISRQTFGNILSSARKKIAECIIGGKRLCIEGGEVEVAPFFYFHCNHCEYSWEDHDTSKKPVECPLCHSHEILEDSLDFKCCGSHRKRGFCDKTAHNNEKQKVCRERP